MREASRVKIDASIASNPLETAKNAGVPVITILADDVDSPIDPLVYADVTLSADYVGTAYADYALHRTGCDLELAGSIEACATGEISVGCDAGRGIQLEDWRVVETTKRVWLRCPVEVSERAGEPVEMMLRPVVIAIHRCERLGDRHAGDQRGRR